MLQEFLAVAESETGKKTTRAFSTSLLPPPVTPQRPLSSEISENQYVLENGEEEIMTIYLVKGFSREPL